MRSVIIEQECHSCGKHFPARYYENGSCRYSGACECESEFAPVDGQPSISEWLEKIEDEKWVDEYECLTEENLKSMFETAEKDGEILNFYWALIELKVEDSLIRKYIVAGQADEIKKSHQNESSLN